MIVLCRMEIRFMSRGLLFCMIRLPRSTPITSASKARLVTYASMRWWGLACPSASCRFSTVTAPLGTHRLLPVPDASSLPADRSELQTFSRPAVRLCKVQIWAVFHTDLGSPGYMNIVLLSEWGRPRLTRITLPTVFLTAGNCTAWHARLHESENQLNDSEST